MMKRDIRTGEKIEKISSRELAGALVGAIHLEHLECGLQFSPTRSRFNMHLPAQTLR